MKSMSNTRHRYFLPVMVFVFSTVFFWSLIMRSLQSSEAQQEPNMKVFIADKEIRCNTNGFCAINIFGNTENGLGVGGVSGGMVLSDKIEPITFVQDQQCMANSFELTRVIGFKTLSTGSTKTVEFGVGSSKADDKLLSGIRCIGSVVIQPAQKVQEGDKATISLVESSRWKAGGTKAIVPTADTTETTIIFSASAPIPTISLAPSPTGTQSNCEKKAKGDCDCSQSIDLIDWEYIRSALNQEGEQCDINGDSTVNSMDIKIWKENNEVFPIKQ